jgi:ribonucleoside-triphosphate reductase
MLVTTQRDYLAGILSTDVSKRLLLPPQVVEYHTKGAIHFHDIDYFLQKALHNCDLINLEDMLMNGTVINGVMVESPHRFSTACTIATQIILGVSSSQYGGCTVSLTHLAPFVRRSYEKFLKKYLDRGFDVDEAEKWAMEDTKIDVADGVQTFNYQVNSMTNTNGQAPFLSVFMYLNETDEYKDELAMIIEEFLKQRIQGLKNEQGVYITQSFPKLLYVLEEDNITEDSKYWYLTELAAECTAKRQVPDYISEYQMLKLKGDCYPCINKTCA